MERGEILEAGEQLGSYLGGRRALWGRIGRGAARDMLTYGQQPLMTNWIQGGESMRIAEDEHLILA